MNTTWCGVLAALVFWAGSADSQVIMPDRGREPGLSANVFGLGLAAGAASGLGLSFRHHLPSVASYQLTGGIIKVNDRLSYSIGAEVQFDLARGPVSRFFVGGGAGYYYSGTSSHNEMVGPARLGVGIGGEYAGGAGLHVSGDLMFTYFSDGTVLPLPQIGLFYYFY
jgi:hypothetical protein